MKLAVRSCGRYQEPCARSAAIPIGIGLVVSLLMKSGTMVQLEMRLVPKKKALTSNVLKTKFQR
jgi:hypothetical protein